MVDRRVQKHIQFRVNEPRFLIIPCCNYPPKRSASDSFRELFAVCERQFGNSIFDTLKP